MVTAEKVPTRGEVKPGKVRQCVDCGDIKLVNSYHPDVKRCPICAARLRRGNGNWNSKGGFDNGQGYIRVIIFPDSPFYSMADSQGRILKHRLVMAEKLGRCLLRSEHVHHLNGNRNDNRLENLQLISQANHNIRQSLCFHCQLREDVKLLKIQNKFLLEQIRASNLKAMEGGRNA
jgi:hypothetical protein